MKYRYLMAMICWLGLSGCGAVIKGEGSSATHYYLLTATATKTTSDGALPRNRVRLALEPVEIPNYLSRPQIAYRQGGNRLLLEEFDLWAEDLDQGLARVMVENLSRLTGSDQVWRLPAHQPKRADYRLWVQFVRFEMDTDGRAALTARWRLRTQDGRETENVADMLGDRVDIQNTESYIAALSHLLESLCRQIAEKMPPTVLASERSEFGKGGGGTRSQ
ncbi:MAG: membrane integrity-associated transporter subunit PqiC [Magnetococcales bacterium]|nr:membrane integrity-associated transporter subunit PqiC [Magnetococcales bacterium]